MIAPHVLPQDQANGRARDDTEPLPRRRVRCAIYTRKSTDEGLEQEFNSLDAQREAGEAFIQSLRGEGWLLLSERYDDGGFSGASLDRPALRSLLDDIDAGRIDCVVVYKVDRLSRSLLDFARIMGLFEQHGVSFVSVTQQFNTASSMGRLVLNVLLSFAQFEREMTAERTRDKIHAARRKGKWTGGHPPLGLDLDPSQGRLVVNPDEAEIVRAIFRLYMERLSLTQTVEELDRRRWTRKRWITKQGREYGGEPFDTVTLHRLLTNPVYVGMVKLKGRVFAGEHSAIVDGPIWERAQSHLSRNGATGNRGARNRHQALLRGLLRCGRCGSTMTHSFTTKKNGVRYRYYRCVNNGKRGSFACPGGSVAAHRIEQVVVGRVREIARDPALAVETVRQAKAQREERVLSLEAEKRLIGKELRQTRAALTRQIGSRRSNRDEAGLGDRLAELEARIRAGVCRLAEVDRELVTVKRQDVDEVDIRRALEAFGPMWDVLWSRERSRILGLLLERIDYDGRDGSLAVRLRPDGIGSLSDAQTA